MSSSCITGGGGAYGFDLEIVKSSTKSTGTSQTSSQSSSSNLSESRNSPLVISTRKPRTPRKRLNQKYNEAAALLSTVYPKIFSTRHLIGNKNMMNTRRFTQSREFEDSSDELLFRFPSSYDYDSGLFSNPPVHDKPNSSVFYPKLIDAGKKSFVIDDSELDFGDDFDAESILDDEIEDGIDSIMGNLSVNNQSVNDSQFGGVDSWLGGNFEFGFCMRRGMSALRHVDEVNWWKFPTVDVRQISPKFNTTTAVSSTSSGSFKNNKKKPTGTFSKKKKKMESTSLELDYEDHNSKSKSGLLLKLNYDDVIDAWSDRNLPFPDVITGSDDATNDVPLCISSPDCNQ